ncbi:hypothetical protein CLV85_2653 [Salinibacterium amurskyense]|uniref:Uncharacterized protein n=1 Tax=Salinibacterium amurskyense TaxID=205941 RepID=A0A2M9D210_9MICO|nr:hypothetical protein [Salinibacterium amurskyense]PJJ78197.1 hypothetical protein CLV85_2653 [Salinibacterium amurskyense]
MIYAIVRIVPDAGCAALKGDAASLRLILFRAMASAKLRSDYY